MACELSSGRWRSERERERQVKKWQKMRQRKERERKKRHTKSALKKINKMKATLVKCILCRWNIITGQVERVKFHGRKIASYDSQAKRKGENIVIMCKGKLLSSSSSSSPLELRYGYSFSRSTDGARLVTVVPLPLLVSSLGKQKSWRAEWK